MKISKDDAIKIIQNITDKDDPYWDNVTEDYYDEKTDTWPTLEDVLIALGVTPLELEKNGYYGDNTPCIIADCPYLRGAFCAHKEPCTPDIRHRLLTNTTPPDKD